jgi:predicted  nucleic acid-binding Zn-ribbon protein
VAQIQLPFGQSLDVLRARVRTTSSDLREADQRLEGFLLENGLVLPREQYLMIASEVESLEREILEAEASGSSTVALEAALSDRRPELRRLGAMLPMYERLRATVERAEEDQDAAQDELRLAENQMAHLEPQTTAVTTELIPRMRTIGRGVGIAAAGGLIVAIALMFLFPSRTAFPSGMQRNAFGFPSRA